jgi:hypothetical protein
MKKVKKNIKSACYNEIAKVLAGKRGTLLRQGVYRNIDVWEKSIGF